MNVNTYFNAVRTVMMKPEAKAAIAPTLYQKTSTMVQDIRKNYGGLEVETFDQYFDVSGYRIKLFSKRVMNAIQDRGNWDYASWGNPDAVTLDIYSVVLYVQSFYELLVFHEKATTAYPNSGFADLGVSRTLANSADTVVGLILAGADELKVKQPTATDIKFVETGIKKIFELEDVA